MSRELREANELLQSTRKDDQASQLSSRLLLNDTLQDFNEADDQTRDEHAETLNNALVLSQLSPAARSFEYRQSNKGVPEGLNLPSRDGAANPVFKAEEDPLAQVRKNPDDELIYGLQLRIADSLDRKFLETQINDLVANNLSPRSGIFHQLLIADIQFRKLNLQCEIQRQYFWDRMTQPILNALAQPGLDGAAGVTRQELNAFANGTLKLEDRRTQEILAALRKTCGQAFAHWCQTKFLNNLVAESRQKDLVASNLAILEKMTKSAIPRQQTEAKKQLAQYQQIKQLWDLYESPVRIRAMQLQYFERHGKGSSPEAQAVRTRLSEILRLPEQTALIAPDKTVPVVQAQARSPVIETQFIPQSRVLSASGIILDVNFLPVKPGVHLTQPLEINAKDNPVMNMERFVQTLGDERQRERQIIFNERRAPSAQVRQQIAQLRESRLQRTHKEFQQEILWADLFDHAALRQKLNENHMLLQDNDLYKQMVAARRELDRIEEQDREQEQQLLRYLFDDPQRSRELATRDNRGISVTFQMINGDLFSPLQSERLKRPILEKIRHVFHDKPEVYELAKAYVENLPQRETLRRRVSELSNLLKGEKSLLKPDDTSGRTLYDDFLVTDSLRRLCEAPVRLRLEYVRQLANEGLSENTSPQYAETKTRLMTLLKVAGSDGVVPPHPTTPLERPVAAAPAAGAGVAFYGMLQEAFAAEKTASATGRDADWIKVKQIYDKMIEAAESGPDKVTKDAMTKRIAAIESIAEEKRTSQQWRELDMLQHPKFFARFHYGLALHRQAAKLPEKSAERDNLLQLAEVMFRHAQALNAADKPTAREYIEVQLPNAIRISRQRRIITQDELDKEPPKTKKP